MARSKMGRRGSTSSPSPSAIETRRSFTASLPYPPLTRKPRSSPGTRALMIFSDGEALNFDPARAVPDSRLLVLKIRQRRIDQVRDLLRQNPPNKAAARLEIERAKTY